MNGLLARFAPPKRATKAQTRKAETRWAALPKKKRTEKERKALIADEMTRHVMPNRTMLRGYGINNARHGSKVLPLRPLPKTMNLHDIEQHKGGFAKVIERNNRRLRVKAREAERRERLMLDIPIHVHKVDIEFDGAWVDEIVQ